jgi:nicotinamidase-related amidase
VEKISFCCCGADAVMSRLKQSGRKQVILFGIEAHVCVLQTCLDLKDLEYQPVIVEDCIGSRKAGDMNTAIRRMVQTGVVISSYESLLFELCRTAGAPEFKTISALVK